MKQARKAWRFDSNYSIVSFWNTNKEMCKCHFWCWNFFFLRQKIFGGQKETWPHISQARLFFHCEGKILCWCFASWTPDLTWKNKGFSEEVSFDNIAILCNGRVRTVRKMRGLQYIRARLQYIGAPEFYFQNSGKDWGGRALIKPGFVYHMMAQLMNWKHFVCRVSCSKIKQKTCLLNRRGSNKLEPRLQYNGAHAPIYWSPSNIFLTQ